MNAGVEPESSLIVTILTASEGKVKPMAPLVRKSWEIFVRMHPIALVSS
ncbi:hypothetical protein EYZ00_21295 [Hafnia paralvei]|nr:hypothetical protein EYZ00_21295 [Hafnia paralvei]